MPHALARFQVEGDQALREQVGSETVTAVVVGRRGVEWQIQVAELWVGAHERPDPDLSGLAPGVTFPGVVAKLVGLRDGVKRPFRSPGSGVEPAHPARRGLLDEVERGDRHRCDDRIADHERRGLDGVEHRVEPVPLITGRARDILHEVDPAVVAEIETRLPALGIDADEVAVPGAPVDPFVAPSGTIRPVRDTALIPARAHRRRALLVALGVVDPQRLARPGVDCRAG